MLTFSSPTGDLPTTASFTTVGAPLFDVPATGTGALLFRVQRNGVLDTNTTGQIPSYTGDTVTINVGTIGSPETITIDGEIYVLSPSETLAEGTFTYDPDTGIITVRLRDGRSPQIGTSYRLTYKAPRYPSGTIRDLTLNEDLPQIFKDWNVHGVISIQRQFENWPSGNFTFITEQANEASVRENLKGGTRLDLFGIGFAIASRPQIKRMKRSEYPGRWIQVSVSLQGKYQRWAGDAVFLRRSLLSSGSETSCDLGRTTVSALAGRAGIPYFGLDPWIYYPADTPDDATTLDSEMRSRARSRLGYTFWSSPDGVGIKPWSDTATGAALSTADITSEIDITCNGDGAIVDGVQLAKEYRNTRLTIEEFNSDDNGDENLLQTFIEGDELADIAPDLEPGLAIGADNQVFRTASNCFDSGGVTKVFKAVQRLNGTPLIERETKHGFMYTSLDTYEIYQKNPGSGDAPQFGTIYRGLNLIQPKWQVVSEAQTTYFYDQSEGYLLGVQRTGYQLVRAKQESDQLEALALEIQIRTKDIEIQDAQTAEESRQLNAERANLIAQRDMYTNFQKAAIADATIYELEALTGYYPDIKPPQNSTEWVVPRFAKRTLREDRSTTLTDDPESTEEQPKPPILAGKDFRESKLIQITYPPRGANEDTYNSAKDRYVERTATNNKEGSQLKNTLAIAYFTENSGRPPIQTRLETRKLDTCRTFARDAQESNGWKYLLNTPDSGTSLTADPEEGSVSFPGILTYKSARICAQCAIAIDNTTSAERWTLTVAPYQRFVEGDRVSVEGIIFVVLGVTEERTIQGISNGKPIITTEGWKLELGRFVNPYVDMGRVKIGDGASVVIA